MDKIYVSLVKDGIFEIVPCDDAENLAFSKLREIDLPPNVTRDPLTVTKGATLFNHFKYLPGKDFDFKVKSADLYYKRRTARGIWYFVWLSVISIAISFIGLFI